MGYYINCLDSKFELKTGTDEQALCALKKLAKKKDLDWINNSDILNSNSIEEALEHCRWKISSDSSLEFLGEKLGNDEDIFNTIASYVKETSYIQISGEDGSLWRWIFEDNICKEINPRWD